MNDFWEDDKWQREQRDAIVVPQLYRRYFWMRYRLLDDDMEMQRRGVDTIIEGKGDPLWVEEKIVRWPRNKDGTPRSYGHDAFALETMSCVVPGYEKSGWMFYCEADRLLYCFQQLDRGLHCWWLDFPALQRWFWPRYLSFPIFPKEKEPKTELRSQGRVVEIESIPSAIVLHNFHLQPAGES